MDRQQLIDRFNERYVYSDQAAVFDWADDATSGDSDLVPLNFVDEMCNAFVRSLWLPEE